MEAMRGFSLGVHSCNSWFLIQVRAKYALFLEQEREPSRLQLATPNNLTNQVFSRILKLQKKKAIRGPSKSLLFVQLTKQNLDILVRALIYKNIR